MGLPHTANATPRKATEHGKGEDWIVPACYIKNKAKSISLLLCVLRQQNIGEVAAGRRGWSYKKLLFYLSHPLSVENYCFFCFSPPIAMRHKGEKRKIYPYITKENVSLTPSHPYPVALQGILTHSSPAVSRNIAGYCGNRYKNNPYYSHTEMAVSS